MINGVRVPRRVLVCHASSRAPCSCAKTRASGSPSLSFQPEICGAKQPTQASSATAARAAGYVGFDRRCPHDRRNMVLRPAVSWRRRNESQAGPDCRSANGTSTRAIRQWSRVRDIGTTTSLTVWGAAASITNVRKARVVLPTTCGLFACHGEKEARFFAHIIEAQ